MSGGVPSSEQESSDAVQTFSEESANMDKPLSGNELVATTPPASDQDDRVRRGIHAPNYHRSVGRAYMRELGYTTNDYERVLSDIRRNIAPTER